MKKSLTAQPKNFRQTLHFWLRRPDYGWADLWHGNALTLEPFEERLERTPYPKARWCIRQKVNGMDSTVYLDIEDIDPAGFAIYEMPTNSWWRNEGRSMVLDYFKSSARNSPSAHGLVVFIALCVGFLYLLTQDPSGRIAFLDDAEIPHLARQLTAILICTPIVSILVNRFFPSRNYLTTMFFRAEAWFLLITALLAAPQVPQGIKDFRAKMLKAASDAQTAGQSPANDPRNPASD